MRLKIRPEYAEIYGIDAQSVPLPLEGESIREYVVRAQLGREENILAVVNDRAKPWDYRFSAEDIIEIYPMAASG
jgi:hypothetical protein